MVFDTYKDYYIQASKSGKKDYSARISRGESGNLTFLEGILSNKDIVSEIYLGVIEVPIKKIIGTNSYARAISFASNFMPIASADSEFASKWTTVCKAHLNEGLRDSIKAYEYLNWHYVVEGNKRISVLKFFDVYSFSAEITRLIPKYDENDIAIRIYYEFIHFCNRTNIRSIWFSNENSFNTLLQYIEVYKPEIRLSENRYKAFERDVYMPFRKIYHEEGGHKLRITTGDALLEYIKLYGIPKSEEIYSSALLAPRIGSLISELKALEDQGRIDIKLDGNIRDKTGVSALTSILKRKKRYLAAFLYPKNISTSNWSYYHDLGRRYAESVLHEYIRTVYYEDIPENNRCYENISEIARKGCDIIFSTSPAFINGTLKAALEFKNTAFFNCSQSYSFKHVTTYFGRIYEAKFLCGIIAGSMAGNGLIGYIGTFPIPEVISCINAFALGVKTVNPAAAVHTAWLNQWDSEEKTREIEQKMISIGIELISHHNIVGKSELSKGYGLYRVRNSSIAEKEHLASPIWNFGIFYEKIISNYINQKLRMVGFFPDSKKSINYWWGMNAGVVDIVYSNRLVPQRTRLLADYLKQGIKDSSYSIFAGPVYDNKGILRIKEKTSAEIDEILSMEWFADNVITSIAKSSFLQPDTNLLTGKLE